MNPMALRALRFASTLVEVAPSVGLQLRHGERVVLRVVRNHGEDADDSGAPVCHPDAFRTSVAHAYSGYLRGQPSGVLEALATGTPTIDVGLLPGDIVAPGGIYRFCTQANHLYMFMTTLAPPSCQRALAGSLGASVASGAPVGWTDDRTWQRVGLHFDHSPRSPSSMPSRPRTTRAELGRRWNGCWRYSWRRRRSLSLGPGCSRGQARGTPKRLSGLARSTPLSASVFELHDENNGDRKSELCSSVLATTVGVRHTAGCCRGRSRPRG